MTVCCEDTTYTVHGARPSIFNFVFTLLQINRLQRSSVCCY